MANPKYRKSISLSPRGYLRARRLADTQGLSLASVVERLLGEAFEFGLRPDVTDAEIDTWKGDLDRRRRVQAEMSAINAAAERLREGSE